jgi:hypothetical protein
LLAIEVDELLEREGRAEEIGRDVFEGGLVSGGDGLAHEGGEARVPPRLELGYEELADRVALEEVSEEVLAKEAH